MCNAGTRHTDDGKTSRALLAYSFAVASSFPYISFAPMLDDPRLGAIVKVNNSIGTSTSIGISISISISIISVSISVSISISAAVKVKLLCMIPAVCMAADIV